MKDIDKIYEECKGIKKMELLADAFRKQVPKKPELQGDGYDPEGNLVYDMWVCPCCNKRYELEYDEYCYCPNCGQRIDWGNEKGNGEGYEENH